MLFFGKLKKTKVLPANLYIFNATSDLAIADGSPDFKPNNLLQTFERTLAILPAYLADKNDIVLLPDQISVKLDDMLLGLKPELPRFMSTQVLIEEINADSLRFSNLRPWGWSPAMHAHLQPVKAVCPNMEPESPQKEWKAVHKYLSGREASSHFLGQVLINNTDIPFVNKTAVAQKFTDFASVQRLMQQSGQLVIKSPWSSSGRGVQILRKNYISRPQQEWIETTIKQQGFIMCEPLWEKVLDFAFQFEIRQNTVKFHGLSFFKTNSNGFYTGNLLHHKSKLPKELQVFFTTEKLKKMQKLYAQTFAKTEYLSNYEGILGIDCMIIQNGHDAMQIHPCVEINTRYNMGFLALQIEKMVAPGSDSQMCMYFSKKVPFADFMKFEKQKRKRIICKGIIKNGCFAISPLCQSPFGMYLDVKQ